MAECAVSDKKGLNPLTLMIIVIGFFAILGAVFSSVSGQYTTFLENLVDTLLTVGVY